MRQNIHSPLVLFFWYIFPFSFLHLCEFEIQMFESELCIGRDVQRCRAGSSAREQRTGVRGRKPARDNEDEENK